MFTWINPAVQHPFLLGKENARNGMAFNQNPYIMPGQEDNHRQWANGWQHYKGLHLA